MNCYFCNSFIGAADLINFNCDDCAQKYDLTAVVNSVKRSFNVCELLYVHIFYDKYHIRLYINGNETTISCDNAAPEHNILTLQGFPLKPSNIKDRLKLLLVFS